MSGMQSKFSNCGCPTETPTAGFNGNPFSPENIKIAYESNPDTNAFTDSDKEKLDGLEEGVKAQVLNLTDGTNTMGQEIIMAGFTIQGLGTAVNATDAINLGQTKQLIKEAPNSTTFVQEDVPDVLTKYETIDDAQGATWFIPSENSTYVYYVDPNGTGQWVEEDSVGDDISYESIDNGEGSSLREDIDATKSFTVTEAINYTKIDKLLGNRIYLSDRQAWFEVVLTATAGLVVNGMDLIQSAANTLYSFKYNKTRDIDAVHLGADPYGVEACDAIFNRMFEIAYTQAKPLWGMSDPYSVSIGASAGFYAFETDGFQMVESGAITGDTMRVDFKGAGRHSTILFSRNAPTQVVRVEGRYCSLKSFAVWGSIDEIRDTEHSATYGINLINMRLGGLSDFRVAHIVGSGLRIGKSIISHVTDGVVYRCGSNTLHAVEQTDSAQDGFQASTFKDINIEDSHGIGAFKFQSHRNSVFNAITFEQQPYYICELSSPSGQFIRDESLTFSNGATGFVALASTSASNYKNNNGQVIIRDLDETGGVLQIGDTVISSGGATGTVKEFTNSGGRQFFTQGEFGSFDNIFLNQNSLRESGNDFVVDGDDNEFGFVRLRDVHKGVAFVVPGTRNHFKSVTVEAGLESLNDQSDYGYSVSVTGDKNDFDLIKTEFSKGISISGIRCTVVKHTARQLYGQGAIVSGDNSTITEVDWQHAVYTDSSDLLTAPIGQLTGVSTAIKGGFINASSARANDVITLSGVSSSVADLHVTNMGGSNNGVRSSSSGVDSTIDNVELPNIPAGKTGFRLVGEGTELTGGIAGGGSSSFEIVADGCTVDKLRCKSYSSQAGFINANVDSVSVTKIRTSNPNGASNDIVLGADVTNSIIKNNRLSGGTGNISGTPGAGTLVQDNV